MCPPESTPEQLGRAHEVLARYEVRLVPLAGHTVVAIWADQDSAVIRGALKIVGWDGLAVRYLDGAGIPDEYKSTRLAGEPVPLRVLKAMEAVIDGKPWEVRDQLLSQMRVYNSPEAWIEEQRRRSFANKNGPPVKEPEPAGARSGTACDMPLKPVNPETGIWRIADWGAECGRGFRVDPRSSSARKERPAKPDAAEIERQRALSGGFALFALWHRWDPASAERCRRLHHDKDRGDEPWLLEMGRASEARQLRLLLSRLEKALEEVRATLGESRDREAANRRFMVAFARELEHMRSRSSGDGDPLGSSYEALKRFLPVVNRLGQETAESEAGWLSSLWETKS
jgi:hypothetical protein